MKKFFVKIFMLFLFATLIFPLSTFAKERYKLVLFYADWNVYSTEAINTLSEVAANSEQQISFEKINLDDKHAFVRMKQLGVMPTNTIPYYFLIDKNDKVIYGSVYKCEDAATVTKCLMNRINR